MSILVGAFVVVICSFAGQIQCEPMMETMSVRYSSNMQCPSGTTECGPGKCCIYENAVCCSDGQHCCPSNYRCDVPNKKCIKEGRTDFLNFAAFEKTLQRMSEKSPIKSCPGGSQMCPSYMSCCLNDNSEWGCCLNPLLFQTGYAGGQCCNTIFGRMCCPDAYPTCTIFGCTK